MIALRFEIIKTLGINLNKINISKQPDQYYIDLLVGRFSSFKCPAWTSFMFPSQLMACLGIVLNQIPLPHFRSHSCPKYKTFLFSKSFPPYLSTHSAASMKFDHFFNDLLVGSLLTAAMDIWHSTSFRSTMLNIWHRQRDGWWFKIQQTTEWKCTVRIFHKY